MKKKFLSIVSLMLAVVLMLPTAVFADTTAQPSTPTYDYLLYFDGENHKTQQLSVEGEGVVWVSMTPGVATVSESGLVTAVAAGETLIRAENANRDTILQSWNIKVVGRSCSSIAVDSSNVKKDYYSGQTFDPSEMVVTATYDNGDTKNLSTAEYTYEPAGALDTTDTSVVVSLKGSDTIKAPAFAINVTEVLITSVEIVRPLNRTFTEGDKITDVEIKVTYNDGTTANITEGFTQLPAANTALTTDMTQLEVSYRNIPATPVRIEVKARPTSGGNTGTTTPTGNIITFTGTIPLSYSVGQSLDFSSVSEIILKQGTTEYKYNKGEAKYNSMVEDWKKLTFTTAQIGTGKSVELKATLNVGGTNTEFTTTITGITVTEDTEAVRKADRSGPDKILDIELKKSKYAVGYEFDLNDIDFVRVEWDGTKYNIRGSELKNYLASTTLEVLDEDGRTKNRYEETIEEDDVQTDRYGDKIVEMRFTFGYEDYEFTVDVGTDPIQFIWYYDVITTYDDLEDALEYTNRQDSSVADDFDLDDVTERRPITIKLGEDVTLDDDYDYDPDNYVIIDLNGYTLTLDTASIDLSRQNENHLVITNSSSTSGTLVYDDMDVTISLAKNENVVFDDRDTIPGIYEVVVSAGKNGTVTSKPKMTSGKIQAGAGSEIVFTITPANKYQLDTIKADGKAVAASGYTKSTAGVITYKYKVGKDDGEISITFKAQEEEKPVWKNPFTDVRSTASYYDAVEFVYTNELFNGTSATTFSPTKTMNRAMFVTVLGRLAGVNENSYKTSSFIDVPLNSTTSWYAPYVEWANQNGIIQGYGNGKFGPMDEITHQQMYTIMYRYAVFVENIRFAPSSVQIGVTDKNEIDTYAEDGVKFATAYDMLVTSGGRIDPKGDAMRWELATVLMKFCENALNWEID